MTKFRTMMTVFWLIWFITTSWDLKSDHSKSKNIQKSTYLKIKFQMVQFSKSWAIAKQESWSLNWIIWNLVFKCFFLQISSHLPGFQMVSLPYFPFKTNPDCLHQNSNRRSPDLICNEFGHRAMVPCQLYWFFDWLIWLNHL